ncbi:hypothetical protein FH972_024211 [Carpinus fangiana]|uniref:Thioredoxin domain-containing protein n=1 Tax=Carpinus fangiana TaxID=176857 RepID=A0A5N6KXD7_9ROSI|nr:hypothetical protein FH972_024211 [Carpinus fangiana]
MSKVAPVASEEEFNTATSSLPPTALQILYFHAPWAAPCAHMSTVLETLASQYPATTPPATAFISINAEELPDVSEAFDVTAVPFIVLRRGKDTLDTISGGDAARVRTAVEKHAGAAPSAAAAKLPPAQTVTRPAEQAAPAPAPAPALAATPSTTNGTPAAPAPSKEELHKRLEELTNAAPCMLFMKGTPSAPQCGFSRQLVAILREHGVRYGFFNILADDDVRQGLKEYADWPTFPQLWLGGELCGGLDIVREEVENDPGFFAEFSVKQKLGAPVAAVQQAAPTVA